LSFHFHCVSGSAQNPPVVLPCGEKGFLGVVEEIDIKRYPRRCCGHGQSGSASEIALLPLNALRGEEG